MPAHEQRHPAVPVFGALIVVALAISFAVGHLTGRWSMARRNAQFVHDPPGQEQRAVLGEHIIKAAERIRQEEYAELREAIERYKKQAPPEQQAGIAASLLIMRERRAERAKQQPMILDIAEGK
jgi:hypothetical protein